MDGHYTYSGLWRTKGSLISLLIANCYAPVFRFRWLQLEPCLAELLCLICYQGTSCFGHNGGGGAQLLPFLVLYRRSVIFDALRPKGYMAHPVGVCVSHYLRPGI